MYCNLFVDLFASKVYTYPMKSRRFIAKKIHNFYEEAAEKMQKNTKIRLQTDKEFIQNIIKKLNKKYNVDMFPTNARKEKNLLQNRNYAN